MKFAKNGWSPGQSSEEIRIPVVQKLSAHNMREMVMNAVRPPVPSVQTQHKPEASHQRECTSVKRWKGDCLFLWILETKNIFLRLETAVFTLVPLIHLETHHSRLLGP